MTSLQPPLLRQPDEMAAAAWEPGFLYLKSVASGARCATGKRRRAKEGGSAGSSQSQTYYLRQQELLQALLCLSGDVTHKSRSEQPCQATAQPGARHACQAFASVHGASLQGCWRLRAACAHIAWVSPLLRSVSRCCACTGARSG